MKKAAKRLNPLPILAAVVVIAAAAITLIPKGTEAPPVSETQQTDTTPAASGGDLVIQAEDIGTEASFFDYDADGTTVQVFAVQASDGTIRLALNTCQVCNGSPYAYFVQSGDLFICQNCMNRFSSTDVGVVSGGCNPVPITKQTYTEQDGTIIIPASFLEQSAALFQNWKNF